MHKILVSGANGQLGRAIDNCQRERGSRNHYLFTDVSSFDICQPPEQLAQMLSEQEVDIVVNCAAYTDVEEAEDEPEKAFQINAEGVEHLATACKQSGAFLIHISTDYVFDGTRQEPYGESDAPHALNVYGESKWSGEQLLWQQTSQAMLIRTAWLYSLHGKNFLTTMLKLTAERDELRVVNDQTGCPTAAADLAAFIVHQIENDCYQAHPGTYHFVNQGACTWYDFAKAIAAGADHAVQIKPCTSQEYPSRAKRPSYSVLSTEKLRRCFSYPIRSWEEALTEQIMIWKQQNK